MFYPKKKKQKNSVVLRVAPLIVLTVCAQSRRKSSKIATISPPKVNIATNDAILDQYNSCGHTTDFYLGKTDLPRANSSKICLGKFISGFVLPR